MGGTPFAYHITFGTYGTRLHGDERGAVDRSTNRPGEPILGRNEDWERLERSRLNFPAVVLTAEERQAIESLIPDVCRRGGWRLHTAAAQPDHVHTLLSAEPGIDPKAVRKLLKRWLHQALDDRFPNAIPRPETTIHPNRAVLQSRAVPGPDAAQPRKTSRTESFATPTWWAECGSTRWVWDDVYFRNVLAYVNEQRATR